MPECKDLATALKHPWLLKFAAQREAQAVALLPNLISNLVYIQHANQLQQAVLLYLATELSDGEVAPMKRAFQVMDVNSDGVLSVEELRAGLHDKIPKEDVAQLIAKMDIDGNGTVSYYGMTTHRASRVLGCHHRQTNHWKEGQAV